MMWVFVCQELRFYLGNHNLLSIFFNLSSFLLHENIETEISL